MILQVFPRRFPKNDGPWKMYLLSNLAILYIYVKFREGVDLFRLAAPPKLTFNPYPILCNKSKFFCALYCLFFLRKTCIFFRIGKTAWWTSRSMFHKVVEPFVWKHMCFLSPNKDHHRIVWGSEFWSSYDNILCANKKTWCGISISIMVSIEVSK